MKPLSSGDLRTLRRRLLRWYRKEKRDLPWRRTRDPYAIWLSEIMLQQTRVETVIPYYQRFLQTFPSVQQLAAARERAVLKHWEGLGYYRRARNLHAAAKEVTERYGGKLPATATELAKLQGFGPYTSAAVASMVGGEPVAAVDGNVTRVVSRLRATHTGISRAAQQLLDPADPGSFNQAMMELGARICLPRTPRCSLCPIRQGCGAYQMESTDRFPRRKEKKRIPTLRLATLVIHKQGRYFVRKRPPDGLWANLWEFPSFELSQGENQQSLARFCRTTHQLDLVARENCGHLRHQLTHRTIDLEIYRARVKAGCPGRGGEWLTLRQLRRRPLSRLQQRVISLALEQ